LTFLGGRDIDNFTSTKRNHGTSKYWSEEAKEEVVCISVDILSLIGTVTFAACAPMLKPLIFVEELMLIRFSSRSKGKVKYVYMRCPTSVSGLD
jgi:hypothetical protein